MALYGSALNKSGNITPHSRPRCSLRHLGVSFCGESICCKSIEETQIVANLPLARVPQRDMVCFCCLALWEKALNQTGNATHLSHARCSLRYLGVGLCGEPICCKPMEETMWTQRIKFPLCEKALNQAGNATHLSRARCSLRHLGGSLWGINLLET